MVIKQLSVFVENRPGALVEVLAVLKANDVNIRALSVADTSDFGILRLIVNEPEQVKRALNEAGFTVKITPVLSMMVADTPGGLCDQVEKLSGADVNIEYMYAFAANAGNGARVVLKVDNLKRAERLVAGDLDGATGVDDESNDGEIPNFYW
ncbi:MAG TPA: ACT domain-containing protein [Patescibacteria group bacterium]|nr:ACT domain-containing protein [Patescibacteria group bacterium]